jgi:hypothetical protein
MDASEISQRMSQLRQKQLETEEGLSDEEVREGISLIVLMRRIRSAGKGASELPIILQEKLEDIF